MLVIKNLSVSTKTRFLVRDISFSLGQADSLVIFGPSGAGKSTILRAIAGLTTNQVYGQIILGEQCLANDQYSQSTLKRRCVLVGQNLGLWPHLTVNEHLRLVKGRNQDDHIEYILAEVGLSDKRDSKPRELSGGQQQRLALGRALVINPRLLLLDEPLSSLDIPNKAPLIKLIKRLQIRQGFSLIYVTHDPFEAQRMASQVIIIESSELKFNGSTEALFDGSAAPWLQDSLHWWTTGHSC